MPVLDADLRILMRLITWMVMRMLMITMEMIKMRVSLTLMLMMMIMMSGGGDEGKRNLPKMKIIGKMRTILVGITPT